MDNDQPDDSKVTMIEHIWIPMSDGVRLAARLFLPGNAERHPIGAVLEYLPYRKRDHYRPRDDTAGSALAKAGIAFIRVDIRGTGDSEGMIFGEYLTPEQNDALESIAWIRRQPWSNGRVGMRGISYSAFNSVHAAYNAPHALTAIVQCCGTEQRYTDDVHYKGGCLVNDQLTWAVMAQAIFRSPPDPLTVGQDRWRQQWQERLTDPEPFAISWLSHQALDDFWLSGTVVEYEKLRCAILHVNGQLDGYINSVPRLMEQAHVPQKAFIGPWAHKWPGYAYERKEGQPGPGIDWLPFEARWWRYWLNGEQNGIMDGPDLWAYRLDRTPGSVYPQDARGKWIAEKTWPSEDIQAQIYYLNPDGLGINQGEQVIRNHRTDFSIGFANRNWYSVETPADLWREQTADDARCLVFDSAPLSEHLDILGTPYLSLRVRADKPVAKVVARLTEVLPDGSSHFVSHFVLNLTHRDGDKTPQALTPGEDYDISIRGIFCCYRFSAGSKLRIAISETWWPVLWPSPELVTLGITTGVSNLSLPVHASQNEEPTVPFQTWEGRWLDDTSFVPGYHVEPFEGVEVTGAPGKRTFKLTSGALAGEPVYVEAADITTTEGHQLTRIIREGDPNSAEVIVEWIESFERPGWRADVRTFVRQRSTSTHFLIAESLEASENGKIVFARQWEKQIERRYV